MIVRPDNLIFYEVDLWFNLDHFRMLEIDRSHINLGKRQTRRGHLSGDQIALIVNDLIKFKMLFPVDQKQYGEDYCDYFSILGSVYGKKYKLIFCICSDRPSSIGIITLFRV